MVLPLLETQLEVFREAKNKAETLQDSSSKGDIKNAKLGLNHFLMNNEDLLKRINT